MLNKRQKLDNHYQVTWLLLLILCGHASLFASSAQNPLCDVKQPAYLGQADGAQQDLYALLRAALQQLQDSKTQPDVSTQQNDEAALPIARTAEERESMKRDAVAGAEKFYRDYLAAYFPKAYVIIEEYLPQMTPEGVDAALQKVVELLGQKQWFYFCNEPKGFSLGEHWENIIEQIRIMHRFLLRTSVNVADGSLVLATDDLFSDPVCVPGIRIKLLDYLNEQGNGAHYDFYALYFDYLIKMFNEGIRFHKLAQARRYQFEMDRVFQKLRASRYEPTYREALARAKELYTLLRQRLGLEASNAFMDD